MTAFPLPPRSMLSLARGLAVASVLAMAAASGAVAQTAAPDKVVAKVLAEDINPQPKSGRQERLENLWNRLV